MNTSNRELSEASVVERGKDKVEADARPGTDPDVINKPVGVEKSEMGREMKDSESDASPGVEEANKPADLESEMPPGEVTGEELDKGPVVIELQYLVEAAAFLVFKNTAHDLEKATKQLAATILGPKWMTDKRMRKELPAFMIEAIGKVSSKSPDPRLSVYTILLFFEWLAKKSRLQLENFQSAKDAAIAEADEVCQAIIEKVKKIMLPTMWEILSPRHLPASSLRNWDAYKAILMQLGCDNAVRTVEEMTERVLEETAKQEFSRAASTGRNGTLIEKSVVEVAVVLKAIQHVGEYVFEYCRDSNPDISKRFAMLVRNFDEDQVMTLVGKLDFMESCVVNHDTKIKDRISALKSSLEVLPGVSSRASETFWQTKEDSGLFLLAELSKLEESFVLAHFPT